MRQNICTIKPLNRSSFQPDGSPIVCEEIITDIPLMRQVVNDMEYNVGSRPTIPSCFEESSELGKVDPLTDIRVSNWDRLAQECILSRSTEPLKVVEPAEPLTDTSNDE